MNGISIFSMSDTNDYTSSDDLIISNESTQTDDTSFGGYLTYFSWVKGVSLYTSNFTISNTYPTLNNYYCLLLTSTSFKGTLGSSVVNNNVYTFKTVPTNFKSTTTTTLTPNFRNIGSLFTDNSMVYYKKGSLPRCGVGSVRNSSVKSKRI